MHIRVIILFQSAIFLAGDLTKAIMTLELELLLANIIGASVAENRTRALRVRAANPDH